MIEFPISPSLFILSPNPSFNGRLKVIAQARRTSCDLGSLPPNFPSPSSQSHQHPNHNTTLFYTFRHFSSIQFILPSPSLSTPTPLLPPTSRLNGLPHNLQSSSLASGQAAQRPSSQDLRLCRQRLGQTDCPCCGRHLATGAWSQDH